MQHGIRHYRVYCIVYCCISEFSLCLLIVIANVSYCSRGADVLCESLCKQRERMSDGLCLHSSSVNIFIFAGKVEIRTFKSRCLKINSLDDRRRCYLLLISLSLSCFLSSLLRRRTIWNKKINVMQYPLGTCTLTCIYAVQVNEVRIEKIEVNDRWIFFGCKTYLSGQWHTNSMTYLSFYFRYDWNYERKKLGKNWWINKHCKLLPFKIAAIINIITEYWSL